METQTAKAKAGTHKDVQSITNDKIVELLEKGIVPWRKPWAGGVPHNLITRNPYRGINLVLLSGLGYEHNEFIREKQMKEIGATIMAGERPHMVPYWDYKGQTVQLRYYLVYNIAQCCNIPEELLANVTQAVFDSEKCERIVADMPHRPDMKSKESMAFYDVPDDYVNIPKSKAFKSESEQFSAIFRQLIHSTGHHTRLDRMGLVQMAEYGYTGPSQEEVLADIGTRYFEAMTGITGSAPWDDLYLQACISKLKADKNFIFTAASLAQKAIDFILDAEVTENVEDAVSEPLNLMQ